MTTRTWRNVPTPNLIHIVSALEKRFFNRCNPTRQPPTKKTLAIAPQHRPSRSIIYFPTLTPTSRVVETSRLGIEPRLSVLETDVLPITPPTHKYAILTRRSRASSRKLSVSVSVNPPTLILHNYFPTQKRNVFNSRTIARAFAPISNWTVVTTINSIIYSQLSVSVVRLTLHEHKLVIAIQTRAQY